LGAGRAVAQRRIARLALAQRQAEEAKAKLDIPKAKKRKIGTGSKASTAEGEAVDTAADAGKGQVTPKVEAEEEAKRKKDATERRAVELNSRPTGPFSGPSAPSLSSSLAPAAEKTEAPMHNRQSGSKDISSMSADTQGAARSQGEQVEQGVALEVGSEKRDPVVGSDIISPLDVLLGDFEEAALNLPMLGSSSSGSSAGSGRKDAVGGLQGPAKGLGKPGGYNRAWSSPALRVR
jgi:hypothetical protein